MSSRNLVIVQTAHVMSSGGVLYVLFNVGIMCFIARHVTGFLPNQPQTRLNTVFPFGITVSPRPRPSHRKPFNAAHSESLTHLQSACLTRSHLASPSSPLSTTAENIKIIKKIQLHNYSVFLYLPPPPSPQRFQHYLQTTYSIAIPPTCNPH